MTKQEKLAAVKARPKTRYDKLPDWVKKWQESSKIPLWIRKWRKGVPPAHDGRERAPRLFGIRNESDNEPNS